MKNEKLVRYECVSGGNVIDMRKYKTAEEFIKGQGEPVYHGSPHKKINKFVAKREKGNLKGVSFTKDYDLALSYAEGDRQKITTAYLDVKNIMTEEKFQIQIADKGMRDDWHKIVKKKGYDAVRFSSREEGDTIIVLNPTQIKTHSQLTDIWNKAQAKPTAVEKPAVKEPLT